MVKMILEAQGVTSSTGNPVLANLFRQNRWANLAVIDGCLNANAELLDLDAPGTCGTIRGTLWHIVNAENHFLAALQGHPDAGNIAGIDATGEDLVALRNHAERIGGGLVGWAESVAADPILEGNWGDGPYRVPASMFAAQALHHGATHRWQITEALARFGADAPDTDGWSWWESQPDLAVAG
jgi:uncharacterized damage-inducible protein DinB